MVATTYGDGSTLGTFARIQIEARWTIRTSVLHTPYSYAELGSMIQSLTDELHHALWPLASAAIQ